jgi:beta-1,4-mannosyl-glycoprotein beta-1,4-N-acetylglucosaminyltransferase
MNLIDCFMYYDEDMLLDVRLNILNKHVSKFIICEATYNHSGRPKKLNFDIKKFKKFKNKIIYLVLEDSPPNIELLKKEDTLHKKNSKLLNNSIGRDNYQRNYMMKEISKFQDEDLIMISDLDEIPNLENFKHFDKINIFVQKMIYYKFNLFLPNFNWMGTKICKKKDLLSPQWLRNIKPKKYSFWRLDTLFSQKKFININFINNGGWHFTNIKKPEDIYFKMSNFAHHLEFENSGLTIDQIRRKVLEGKMFYDHTADKTSLNKWGVEEKLKKVDANLLPDYLSKNKEKFKEWFHN